jgi:hypothetical protein
MSAVPVTGGLPVAFVTVAAGGGAGSIGYHNTFTSGTFALRPHVGDRVFVSFYYDRKGHDYFTATDITQRTTQAVRVRDTNAANYDNALLRGFRGGSNVTPPAADTLAWQFTGTKATTYDGRQGSVLGPWVTRPDIATTSGSASGTVLASPAPLQDNGQNFAVWMRALPVTYTSAFAGYADSGGPLRYVSTVLTVPARQVAAGNGESALITLGHNGGPTPRPYADISVLPGGGAGSVTYATSTASGRFALAPKPRDQLSASIYYDQHGHDDLTVTDVTRHKSQTVKVNAPLNVAQMPYNSAEILAEIDNGTVTPPSADVLLWDFTDSHVTTYTGNHGTILGPWASREFTDTTDGTAAGSVVMSPSVLSGNGQDFGAWLRHR